MSDVEFLTRMFAPRDNSGVPVIQVWYDLTQVTEVADPRDFYRAYEEIRRSPPYCGTFRNADGRLTALFVRRRNELELVRGRTRSLWRRVGRSHLKRAISPPANMRVALVRLLTPICGGYLTLVLQLRPTKVSWSLSNGFSPDCGLRGGGAKSRNPNRGFGMGMHPEWIRFMKYEREHGGTAGIVQCSRLEDFGSRL